MNTTQTSGIGNNSFLYIKWYPPPNHVTLKRVTDAACDYFGLDEEKVKSKSRKRELALCRFIIFGIVKKKSRLSLKSIADEFSRDHTSVIHGLQTLKDLMDTDETIRKQFNEIEAMV